MTISAGDLRVPAVPAGVTLVEPSSDSEVLEASRVNDTAFGTGSLGAEATLRRHRAMKTRGALVLLALVDGKPAGVGTHTAPRDGVAVIAGIAVLHEFRGRGVGSLVCAELTARLLTAGVIPYLTTEVADLPERLYRPLGYRVTHNPPPGLVTS